MRRHQLRTKARTLFGRHAQAYRRCNILNWYNVAPSPAVGERGCPGPAPAAGEGGCPCPAVEVAGSSPAAGVRNGPGRGLVLSPAPARTPAVSSSHFPEPAPGRGLVLALLRSPSSPSGTRSLLPSAMRPSPRGLRVLPVIWTGPPYFRRLKRSNRHGVTSCVHGLSSVLEPLPPPHHLRLVAHPAPGRGLVLAPSLVAASPASGEISATRSRHCSL